MTVLHAPIGRYAEAPPDEPEFDTSPYVERLIASPTFCEEAIGNAGREIYVAYADKDHLSHVIDVIIEREANRVIEEALDRCLHSHLMHDACLRAVCLYTDDVMDLMDLEDET